MLTIDFNCTPWVAHNVNEDELVLTAAISA